MKKRMKTSPDGVRDLLFNECKLRRSVENDLKEVFRLRGYHEVITPALEYYDIFSFANTFMPLETMYKLTDLSGRLLVMRPDITVPIARIITTNLKDAYLPIKLSYNQNVFRISPNLSGRRHEIAQSGVELIGTNGIKSDLEIITCAVEAMQSFCGDSFRFEIGHVGFFDALMKKLPLSEEEREEVNTLIRIKNYALLNDALSKYKELPAARGLMSLPSMFGGPEEFQEARMYCDDEDMQEIIGYLEKLYSYMVKLGLEKQVIIDLGLVPENVYYTGIVFRGYTDGPGMPVLSGGRYDDLYKEFGSDLSATGFAIYVDEVVKSLMKNKSVGTVKSHLIHAEEGYETEALHYAESLRKKGIACALSTFDEFEQSLGLAELEKAENFVLIGENIKFIIKDGVYQ